MTVPAHRCRLRPEDCVSAETVFNAFMRDLPLPEHFGRNLDALWDVLSTDIEEPLEIVIVDMAALLDMEGDVGEDLCSLLTDLAAERDDVRVVMNEL
jgi:ribonuclease inhibitor